MQEAAPLPVWRRAFLAAYCLNGNVSDACAAAQIERSTAYRAKGNDPDFALEWAAAEEVASDALLSEAWRRAVEGGRSYKFDKDGFPLRHPETHEPYYEVSKSDSLLLALLKARLPALFGDKLKLDASVNAKPAYDLSRLNPEQLAQLEALTRAATPPGLPAA
ncbi:MAG: hypothetical protein ACRYFK_14420 [Janthinobacterium lividum]